MQTALGIVAAISFKLALVVARIAVHLDLQSTNNPALQQLGMQGVHIHRGLAALGYQPP